MAAILIPNQSLEVNEFRNKSGAPLGVGGLNYSLAQLGPSFHNVLTNSAAAGGFSLLANGLPSSSNTSQFLPGGILQYGQFVQFPNQPGAALRIKAIGTMTTAATVTPTDTITCGLINAAGTYTAIGTLGPSLQPIAALTGVPFEIEAYMQVQNYATAAGTGSGATFSYTYDTATAKNLTSVAVTAGGSGYTTPYVVFSAGTVVGGFPVVALDVISGVIVGARVIQAGGGITVAPTATVNISGAMLGYIKLTIATTASTATLGIGTVNFATPVVTTGLDTTASYSFDLRMLGSATAAANFAQFTVMSAYAEMLG